MKTVRNHLKLISLLLSFTFILQSCKVYQSKTVTVDEAVQSKNRVKIISNRNETYKFKVLQKENDQLFGVTKKNSSTAKNLTFQKFENTGNSKNVKFLLPYSIVKEIHLQNKTLSTIITIAIPVVIVVTTIYIIGSSLNSIDYGNWDTITF